jgi:hypothetical protein
VVGKVDSVPSDAQRALDVLRCVDAGRFEGATAPSGRQCAHSAQTSESIIGVEKVLGVSERERRMSEYWIWA